MSETNDYDVVVIGGGPGGYVAAIRAAQLGQKTLCIDDRQGADGKPAPGGTCLNVGCIPSKALLDSTKHYDHLQHHYAAHGIRAGALSFDVAVMQRRKAKIVAQLNAGVSQLLKANGIEFAPGRGRLGAGRRVTIAAPDGTERQVTGHHVILASGSEPLAIPNVAVDNVHILDNEGALALDQVPGKLGVIGAGVIGLELGSVWRRLGSEVVLFEALDDFLAAADRDIAKLAAHEFKKQGLDIRLGTKVDGAVIEDGKVRVRYSGVRGDGEITVDRLLVAVGRTAASAGLLEDDSGVELDDRGRVTVDDHNRTTAEGVFAIGDLVRGPMLAHKASEEGIAVAEIIAGQAGHVNLDTIPWVIYTDPEIAWAGKTEEELKAAGADYRSGSFPFAATGRGLAMGEAAGAVKVLADAASDRLLGVHIIGPSASELIGECVVALEFSASAEDLARIVHAHPTLSEAIHEAALNLDHRAIHRVNR